MEYLQIILYVLGSILLVALIILIVKLIKSINRVNHLLDDVEEKMETVNQIFGVVDKFTDSFALVSDKVVDLIAGFISKLFKKKSKKKEEMEDF